MQTRLSKQQDFFDTLEKLLSSPHFISENNDENLTRLLRGQALIPETSPEVAKHYALLQTFLEIDDMTVQRVLRGVIALKLLKNKFATLRGCIRDDLLTGELHDSLISLDDNQWQIFCQLLQSLQLIGLNLSTSRLGDLEESRFQTFCESLQSLSSLTWITLTYNSLANLGPTQWESLEKAFRTLPALRSLDLSHCDLAAVDTIKWQSLCKALQQVTQLRSLDFSANNLQKLNAVKWQALGEAIKHTQLRSLIITSNRFGRANDDEWKGFCAALQTLPQLKMLDLCENDLDQLSRNKWKIFCEALQSLTELTTLNISYNDLASEEQWEVLVSTIKSNLFCLVKLFYSQTATTLLSIIPPSIEQKLNRLIERNRVLTNARESAEKILLDLQKISEENEDETEPLDTTVVAALDQLTSAMALLADENSPIAAGHLNNLQSLRDDLALKAARWFVLNDQADKALHFFQEVSPSSSQFHEARLDAFDGVFVSLRDNPDEKASPTEAFLKALPLCLDQQQLFPLTRISSRFDGHLLEAVGIHQSLKAIPKITPEIRLLLLKYLFLHELRNILQKKSNESPTVFFLHEQRQTGLRDLLTRDLIPIDSLEALQMLPINHLWETTLQKLEMAPLPIELDTLKEFREALSPEKNIKGGPSLRD